jgi:outer membrane receptor protein involved in Fe transport|tara:strand:- start:322 stop:3303 length:2982 start_codon:yes stop_codon:yes gene_type:complete
MKINKLTLLFGLVFSFAAIPFSALAQDDVEEVVVTGTRIADPNVTSSSQITSIDGEELLVRGITRVEDYLNDLPQISPGQSITNSNGASGTATANLRNLGCSRTLVLMNGRRMVSGTTGGGNCADLNTVPTLLLDKVEVLTGGASSVYGSDAVAGVVNFILDDEFVGMKSSFYHGFYQHKNDNSSLRDLVASYDYALAPKDVTTGDTEKVSVAFGGEIDGGKGHITAFMEHTDTKPILQGEYDISACALRSGFSGCGGSSTIPPGRWADFGGYTAGGFVNADPSITGVDFKVLGNEFVPRAGQAYNYNPTNFFQRPDDRFNSGFFGKYEVSDNAEVYVDMTYMKSESNAQIAYSGTFGNITSLPCYNAFLSEQQYNAACGDWTGMGGDHAPDFASGAAALAYLANLDLAVGDGSILGYKAPLYSLKRNVEGNPRQSIFAYKSFTQTVGVRGDINDNWSYDAYYQTSNVVYNNEYRNDLSVTAINRAVDVVSVNGVPTCVSALNGTDSTCVPYNLFQGGLPGDQGIQGVIDGGQELQSYIANSTYINGDGEQTTFTAYVTGDLGYSIPGAPGSISMVAGFESRELSSDFRPDLPSRTGDRSGSGGATLPLGGSYDVDEFFVELGIPVTDTVSMDAGFRSADYSTGNDTTAMKLGAFWTVNDKVSVRGSFQTSQRHANLAELYQGIGQGLVDLDYDPCGIDPDTGAAPIATQEQCLNTGLPANLYGTDLKSPADQYNIQTGGNPNVNPEESESMTIGVVLNPMDGLTLTVDYFDITVEDGIGTVSPKTALDKCIETGAAAFCNLINRNPVNGSLWLTGGYISAQITNISEEQTSGIDVIFDYSVDTNWGPLVVSGVTTLLDSYDIIELPGEAAIGCSGNWGGSCGKNPMPEVMGSYTVGLTTEFDTDVILGVRYLGETDDLNANDIDFDAYTYLDATAIYSVNDNMSVTLGVSNLLDKEPGYTSDAGTAPGNGNTFPGYFDAFGRHIHLSINYSY